MANGDMAKSNGDSHDIHDAATRIGILSQRTATLESAVGDVRRELGQFGQTVNNSISSMSSRFDERFNALSATMAERSRPQWQALSVMLAVVVVLGGLVWWPIREQMSDVKSALTLVAEKMVTREELDWRSQRGTEDRARTELAIADLRSTMTPMALWMGKNDSRDHDIQNLRDTQAASVMAIQRQLDQQRTDLTALASSLGSGRDTFADLKQEQAWLRNQVAELLARSAGRTRFP